MNSYEFSAHGEIDGMRRVDRIQLAENRPQMIAHGVVGHLHLGGCLPSRSTLSDQFKNGALSLRQCYFCAIHVADTSVG
jgi:hypothetical protein